MAKNNVGRPSLYNKILADKICVAVATSTAGLTKICQKNPDFPHPDSIYEWRYRHKEFSDNYANAKRTQAELMAEEIVAIADDGTNDTYIDDDGNIKTDTDVVSRSRLRVDTRKWIACKLLPKIYGDKVHNETTLHLKQEDALKELE